MVKKDELILFTRKVVIVIALVASLGLVVYAFKYFLLIFAAVCCGTVLNRASRWLETHTPVSYRWALTSVLVGLGGILVGSYFLLAPEISSQLNTMSETLPQAQKTLVQKLESLPWLKKILGSMFDGASGGQAVKAAGSFLSNFTGTISAFLFILFGGIFLAANPPLYLDNILKLLPTSSRPQWRGSIDAMGAQVAHWILAQLALMLCLGTLTIAGLLLLGLSMGLTLGLLTALLLFVPYVGAVVSAIPALLIALSIDSTMVWYVALIYVGAHIVESYLLAPILQRKLLSLPPALVLSFELILGYLGGIPGIALATPLLAVTIVAVNQFYLKRTEETPADLVSLRGGGSFK